MEKGLRRGESTFLLTETAEPAQSSGSEGEYVERQRSGGEIAEGMSQSRRQRINGVRSEEVWSQCRSSLPPGRFNRPLGRSIGQEAHSHLPTHQKYADQEDEEVN